MEYRAIEHRLRRAMSGFKVSFWLSLLGTTVEALVVMVMYNIVLFADLAHWVVDTVLEALFMVSLNHASRTSRRFPLGTLFLESILVTVVAVIVIGVYGYVFVDYFINYRNQELSGVYHPALSLVTALGAVLTATTMLIQKRKYEELKLEIVRIDYVHAVLDTFAAIIATLGILVVAFTQNSGFEALFTAVLTFFVFHSIIEVLRDTFRTVTGRNVDPDLKLRVFEKLVRELADVRVKNVDARKIGSFYIVSVHVGVDPRTTILEAYRIRSRIVDAVREISDLIYHVDVSISPYRTQRRKHK
ncbi:MAG: cation transporter [Desulfurococcaceae archaeon]